MGSYNNERLVMKHFLLAAAIAATTFTTPALATDVGVSVTVGQPGFYGRIDIGDYPYPPPRVIYRQPRVVERVVIEREPVYLRVPPGHAKNWSKHCHKYNACGERVYFVRDDWYEREYVPHYREYHHEHRNDYREEHRGNGRGH
jgi:hypothetical protein